MNGYPIRFLSFIFILSAGCASSQQDENTGLSGTASFPIGASVNATLLRSNQRYRSTLDLEFNSITAENAMKMNWISKENGKFNFRDADDIVHYARRRNKRVHGHTLVWHWSGNMDWLKTFAGDSAAWENLFKSYIQSVVRYFKGRVTGWDVVNEAFDDDGSLRLYDRDTTDTRDGGSIWARKLGHNYVARAFQYAHEADPKALLFYNDYGHENSPAKLDAILNLVDDFKRQGIPIHGLGLQMHLSLSTPDSAIETALRRCTATGLLIHISELDIAVSNWKKNASLQYTDSLQKRQAEKFRFVAEAYRKIVPEKQRYGITFWNVGDGDSWLRSFIQSNEWPLLFDESYERKPAYDEFKRGLVD